MTTQQYLDLGAPKYLAPFFTNGAYSYRYVVHDSKTYNVFVSYRIESARRWLNGTSVRFGVNNLFDAEPPLSSDSRGYDPSLYNVMARGRTSLPGHEEAVIRGSARLQPAPIVMLTSCAG